MRKWTFIPLGLFFLAACGLVCGTQQGLRAQSPTASAASSSTPVAVVDLPKVFESHPTFKTKMEAIQQELKKADQDLNVKQKELNARMKELNDLNPTSEGYRRIESDLARKGADLQVQARQAKKEFMQREALQYYSAFQEITAAVKTVADRYNIGLVLRFETSEVDPQKPQTVLQAMSRAVVVQRNLDITHLVVTELQTSLARKPSGVRR